MVTPEITIQLPAGAVKGAESVTVTVAPVSEIETMLADWLGKLIEPTLLNPLAALNWNTGVK